MEEEKSKLIGGGACIEDRRLSIMYHGRRCGSDTPLPLEMTMPLDLVWKLEGDTLDTQNGATSGTDQLAFLFHSVNVIAHPGSFVNTQNSGFVKRRGRGVGEEQARRLTLGTARQGQVQYDHCRMVEPGAADRLQTRTGGQSCPKLVMRCADHSGLFAMVALLQEVSLEVGS